MQRLTHKITLLVATLFVFQTGFSQDKEKTEKEKVEPKFKKTKSYSKSYSLGGNDKVSLSNQFGEMKFNTWDKNEIKVDVSITGKSDDEQRAQQILDKISIEDNHLGNTVSFQTKFADDHWNSEKGETDRNENRNENRNRNRNENIRNSNYHEGMEVNYTVYLPSTATLKAANQFGKMIIPDYRGQVDLSSKFGSLSAGKLSNTKEVNVEFGTANIASINGGDLGIKFSSGTVSNISGDVNADLQFSQVKLIIDNDAKNIDLHTSYATTYLDLDKSFSGNYTINTSHGNFDNQTSFPIKEEGGGDKGYGPHFNRKYRGTSNSGSTKVTVNSSFGDVIAGHDLKVDLTEKKRGKNTRVI
jgi:hypothetical protein